jgi:hypothetical protein
MAKFRWILPAAAILLAVLLAATKTVKCQKNGDKTAGDEDIKIENSENVDADRRLGKPQESENGKKIGSEWVIICQNGS